MATSGPAPEDIMLPPSPPESPKGTSEPVDNASGFSVPVERSDNAGATSTATSDAATLPQLGPSPPPPRKTSPLPRTHLRSRSLAAAPTAPFMTRAHSSPGVDSRGRYVDPIHCTSSPTSKPKDLPLRRPSPLRVSMEEDSTDTISEHPEPQESPASTGIHLDVNSTPQIPSPGMHNTFPRSIRRRPSSPLNPNSNNVAPTWCTSNPMSSQSSQTSSGLYSGKYNEPHPAYSFSSGSSMPSTPSSLRSRSPSISSLETIPDIPDAEAAEYEADQIARLKAAADKADAEANNEVDQRQGGAMDRSASPGPFGNARFNNLARADKRKRWSVCGAEGRHDLDLETIWED